MVDGKKNQTCREINFYQRKSTAFIQGGLMKKNRWFIKEVGSFTNNSLMDWLSKIGEHQDGIAAQEIIVKGSKTWAIEVPSYELIRALVESAKHEPHRFEVLIMPPGARQAGPWRLPRYQKIARPKPRAKQPSA
jgi:hypothetical protein